MNEELSNSANHKKRSHSTVHDSVQDRDLHSSLLSAPMPSEDLHDDNKRQRHSEHGLLLSLSPFSVVIRFETFLTWILALDPNFIQFIYLPDFICWMDFQKGLTQRFHNKLLVESILSLTPSKFVLGNLDSNVSLLLHLYSGSLAFLHRPLDPTSSVLTISIVDNNFYCRSLPPSPLAFTRLSHKSVGGVTNTYLMWSALHMQNYTPHTTTLRRRIGSIIDLSIRSSRSVGLPISSPHLTTNQLLPKNHLGADICVPSAFSASGFGLRKLHSSELLVAFGFPMRYHHLPIHPSDLEPIIPLQLLDALLRPAVLSLSSALPLLQAVQFAPPTPLSVATYLPKLGIVLPNDWYQEKEHVQQAAKEDNVPIDFNL